MAKTSIKINAVFNAIKSVSSIIFPLITFPYISHVLLPDNVGKINFGQSIVAYFSLIASLGITTYAIRECSASKDDMNKLSDTASQIFSINILTTVFAYFLLGLTLIFYHKLDNYRFLIIIQSLTILATTFSADWLNSAMEDFRYITIRTVAFQFLSLLLVVIFVNGPDDYIRYAIISLISCAGASMVNTFYRRKFCKVEITWNIDWKRHMKPICLLFVMILAQTIFNNIDITMLGIMKGDYEVGIYSTAHKIMELINQLIASLFLVVMPQLVQLFESENYVKINELLKKVLLYFVTLGFPCIVGVSMVADDIITVIAGTEYTAATNVLRILMVSFGFMLVGGNFLGNSILLPARKEKIFMVACCISTVTNICANFIFIPKLGARGAAITTALSELIILIILLFYRDKRIVITELQKVFIAPFVGCILIIVVCLCTFAIKILWIRLIVTIVISVPVYAVIQILLKNALAIEVWSGLKNRIKPNR